MQDLDAKRRGLKPLHKEIKDFCHQIQILKDFIDLKMILLLLQIQIFHQIIRLHPQQLSVSQSSSLLLIAGVCYTEITDCRVLSLANQNQVYNKAVSQFSRDITTFWECPPCGQNRGVSINLSQKSLHKRSFPILVQQPSLREKGPSRCSKEAGTVCLQHLQISQMVSQNVQRGKSHILLYQYPKSKRQDYGTCLWIKQCGRPQSQLNTTEICTFVCCKVR